MTNPDTTPFTAAYALAVVAFGVAFIALAVITHYVSRALDRHEARALADSPVAEAERVLREVER